MVRFHTVIYFVLSLALIEKQNLKTRSSKTSNNQKVKRSGQTTCSILSEASGRLKKHQEN